MNRDQADQDRFFGRSVEDCDSPTVGPLRIFKPGNPAEPEPSNIRNRYYPPPPVSSSSSRIMSFPLPPGASSSANPLPFPDDDEDEVEVPAEPHSFHSTSTSPPQRHDQRHDQRYGQRYGQRDDEREDPRGPSLAERRGNVLLPIKDPSSPDIDHDGLFAKPIIARNPAKPPQPQPQQHQNPSTFQYPPPPDPTPDHDAVEQQPARLNRFPSTASISTVRASRGSPPPPPTPVEEPGSDIEARYAASGISGTASLNGLQVLSSAASSRIAQYGRAPTAAASPPRRPWTPTESPGHAPHGPTTVYLGMAPMPSDRQDRESATLATRPVPNSSFSSNMQVSVLEQDFQRLVAKTPPPAYATVTPAGPASSYPIEKGRQPQTSTLPVRSNEQGRQPRPGMPAPSATVPTATPSTACMAIDLSTPTAFSSASPLSQLSSLSSSSFKPQKMSHEASSMSSMSSPVSFAGHPAFANDLNREQEEFAARHGFMSPVAGTGTIGTGTLPLASPPPLPEGWISHLDQNSGQYYYIHLATQSTQWEFPKGPNPLNPQMEPPTPTSTLYANPLSPIFSAKSPLSSPMFPPQTPGYAESIMSVAHSTATATSISTLSGPPPIAGVNMFRIQPSNGVYFGPYLRYVNIDLVTGIWHGSILVVTDAPQPPTIHVHLTIDLSPNPRQLMPNVIYTHNNYNFYKYEMDLQMDDEATKHWTYAVTSHLGCTRYEFVVAGRNETCWRFIAHSNNDFTPSTNQQERTRLGGAGFMWKDVLQKNVECGGFHVQLGLGSQVYGDRLWRDLPSLKQWLALHGKESRKKAPWTARHEDDVLHAYFHYYTSHFDQPYMREAFAQIPHILQLDDHDIFDGFGSYPEYMQNSQMFQNIGRLGIEMFLLFQHHTTVEILRDVSTDLDLFTVTGHGWHFVKYLGPSVAVIAPDCRSEKNRSRVMAGPTYQGIFPKVALLPPSVQHCIWMLSVPVLYPRLDTMESFANTLATGKKAVNTTYNLLGKVTSTVAGVVGGKEIVQQSFTQVKKAVGKGGLMGNVLNQFGEVDMGEAFKDLWTHESKDLERTYLIRTLQGVALQKGLRMTFLSGDVNCCGAALLHDPSHPNDHKTMYQIITSPIVAQPQGSMLLKVLHNDKTVYVPANGKRSNADLISDTKEDMLETFQTDPNGLQREHRKLCNRRNYAIFFLYNPAVIANPTAFAMDPAAAAAAITNGQHALLQQQLDLDSNKLSLAITFVVQADGSSAGTSLYGPVVVPSLEFGQ